MFFCDTGVGVIQPYWSEHVVEEAIKNICENSSSENPENIKARFENMNDVYDYANVEGYEGIDDIDGVDSKDQVVAKAAIFNECDFLVTNNLKHFKNAVKLSVKPKALTADSFLTAIANKYEDKALEAVVLAWWHRKDFATFAFSDYLDMLKRKTNGQNLPKFINKIEEVISKKGKNPQEIATGITSMSNRRY